jgi:hypothetical protein
VDVKTLKQLWATIGVRLVGWLVGWCKVCRATRKVAKPSCPALNLFRACTLNGDRSATPSCAHQVKSSVLSITLNSVISVTNQTGILSGVAAGTLKPFSEVERSFCLMMITVYSPKTSHTRAAHLTIEMTFLEKESGATRWDLGFF